MNEQHSIEQIIELAKTQLPPPGKYVLTEKPEPVAPRKLNRRERRIQEKRARLINKHLNKQVERVGRGLNLTPEEEMAVKQNLLAKVIAKNAEFDRLREEEKQG